MLKRTQLERIDDLNERFSILNGSMGTIVNFHSALVDIEYDVDTCNGEGSKYDGCVDIMKLHYVWNKLVELCDEVNARLTDPETASVAPEVSTKEEATSKYISWELLQKLLQTLDAMKYIGECLRYLIFLNSCEDLNSPYWMSDLDRVIDLFGWIIDCGLDQEGVYAELYKKTCTFNDEMDLVSDTMKSRLDTFIPKFLTEKENCVKDTDEYSDELCLEIIQNIEYCLPSIDHVNRKMTSDILHSFVIEQIAGHNDCMTDESHQLPESDLDGDTKDILMSLIFIEDNYDDCNDEAVDECSLSQSTCPESVAI